MNAENTLVVLDQASKALAQIRNAKDAKQVLDFATVAEMWAKKNQLGEELIKSATNVRIRALRELGVHWQDQPKAHGARGAAGPGRGKRGQPQDPRLQPPTLGDLRIPKKTAAQGVKLAKLSDAEFKKVLEAAESIAAAIRLSVDNVSSGDEYDGDEWFTPEAYIEAAREVLGEIDLDPATCELAQQRIEATTFYTKKDNGLDYDWKGRVWLNPPYSQPAASLFTQKLLREYLSGNVTAAIVLMNACTDTEWFHELAAHGQLCLTKGRVAFERDQGGESTPHGQNRQGQVFFYFGPDTDAFHQVFKQFGLVGSLAGMPADS